MRGIIFTFFLCVASMPLCRQTKGQPSSVKRPADAKTSEPKDRQKGTKEFPIFVHVFQDPQSQADAAKAEKGNQRKETVDLVTAWSAGLAALFTGLLVIVGYCGVRAAIKTLKAIEHQGKQMAAQVALMEIPFQPRIEFSNWGSGAWTPPSEFRITMNLINPTDFPITIKAGSLKVMRENGSSEYLIGPPVPINPRGGRVRRIHFFRNFRTR